MKKNHKISIVPSFVSYLFSMVAFQIFGFSIYWYGIFYAVAFLVGYFFLKWIGQQKIYAHYPKVQKLLTEDLETLLCIIAGGVLIGGRLGHIIIYGEGYYLQHPLEILQIHKGGMSFIGGLLGVFSFVAGYLRRNQYSWKEFLLLADSVILFVPVGIMLGRFGNFLNQELYGIPIVQLPELGQQLLNNLGLSYQYQGDSQPRVNTNFLSILLEGGAILLTNFFIFWRMIKKKKFTIGLLTMSFMIQYCSIRFGLEYLRADSQREFIRYFTKSQRFFISFIVISCSLWWNYPKSAINLTKTVNIPS